MPARLANRRIRPRVMPGRMALLLGVVSRLPSSTPKKLVCVPSVMVPSGRWKIASTQPASTAFCMARTLPSRFVDLMSQRPQRVSGRVMTAAPSLRQAVYGATNSWTYSNSRGIAAAGCLLHPAADAARRAESCFCFLTRRQPDRELRAPADLALHVDAAAVGLDDLPRGRQTQAGAARLR